MADEQKATLSFDVSPLTGGPKRTYTIRPITGWEAMRIFDGQIKQIMGALGVAVTGGDERAGHALRGIEYEATQEAIKAMLRGAVIRSATTEPIFRGLCVVEFRDADAIGEYYGENPAEYYQALAQCINANWPSVFSEARKRIALLWEKGQKVFRAFRELNTPLPQTSSTGSESKDSGG